MRSAVRAAAVVVVLAVIVGTVVFVVRAPRPRGESNQAPAARVEATFTRLTTQSGVEQFPSLSPDGRWVVYTSGEPGSEDIYLQSVGGQTAINLTKIRWTPTPSLRFLPAASASRFGPSGRAEESS